MKKKNVLFKILTGTSVLVAIFLLNSQLVDMASAQDVIRIGASTSLTGNLSREGLNQKRAYDFWMNLVNSKGGIKVGNKQLKVDMKIYDDESNTIRATKLYEKLIVEDGIKLLVGPYGSGQSYAASVIPEKYKVPMSSGSQVAANIYERGFKYTFGVAPTTEFYSGDFFRMIDKFTPRPKNIAILAQNVLFAIEVAGGQRKHAKEYNFNVVYDELFPSGSQDLSSEITRLKSVKPDVVCMTGYTNVTGLFVKQSKELRFNVAIPLIILGPTMEDWRKAIKEDSNFLYSVAHWDECVPFKDKVIGTAGDFIKLWQEKFGFPPEVFNAADVAACLHLQFAIEKANSTDPEKVTEALASLDTETFYGPVRFDEKRRNVGKGPCYVVQIQKEKVVLVYPTELVCRGSKGIYPVPPWESR